MLEQGVYFANLTKLMGAKERPATKLGKREEQGSLRKSKKKKYKEGVAVW